MEKEKIEKRQTDRYRERERERSGEKNGNRQKTKFIRFSIKDCFLSYVLVKAKDTQVISIGKRLNIQF